MKRDLVAVSKFLSYVLRHRPQHIGLVLDAHGWAAIDELIRLAPKAGRRLTRELIEEVVRSNDKQRFSISDDGTRIRASQGHSVSVDLALSPAEPPTILYHGTVLRNISSIKQHGLERRQRHHVHLSSDERTARSVGARHGEPLVLRIRAGAMFHEGYLFYLSDNGVWLTDNVPVRYIMFPS